MVNKYSTFKRSHNIVKKCKGANKQCMMSSTFTYVSIDWMLTMREWFGKDTTHAYWKMLPQACGGREWNSGRENWDTTGLSSNMSESKLLGLLRYISKSSCEAGTEPESMGSGSKVSRGEITRWASSFCSESREGDKRNMLNLLSWLWWLAFTDKWVGLNMMYFAESTAIIFQPTFKWNSLIK